MSVAPETSVLEHIEVRHEEQDDDNLGHYFCKCGWSSKPQRARCGKVKDKWTPTSMLVDPICAICDEERKLRTCVCDAW